MSSAEYSKMIGFQPKAREKERKTQIDFTTIKKELSDESARLKRRNTVKPFIDYLEESLNPVETGLPQEISYITAAGHIRRAIESKGVIQHPWSVEYPFFSQRQDRNQVIGNHDVLEDIVGFIRSHEDGTESRDKILLIIGPAGSGKSTVADALKTGYEEYAATAEPPIFALEGCPVHENPLNILQSVTNENIQDQLPNDIELCPDCKERLHTDYDSDLTKFPVKALDISVARGIGITKLEVDMTAGNPGMVNSLIRDSNGGILEIAEYSKHSDMFRKKLAEIMTSRKIQTIQMDPVTGEPRRREYPLNNIVIGTTTLIDWLKEKDDLALNFPGELRRIKEIYWPYVTSISDEAAIYKKSVEQNPHHPHVNPIVYEMLARVAIPTRLNESVYEKAGESITVTPEMKLDLYNGVNTETFDQQDRREIQRQSRKSGEGLQGIPPTFMTEVLSEAVIAYPECLTTLQALKVCENYIHENPGKLPVRVEGKKLRFIEKEELLENIAYAREDYDTWLLRTFRKAFREDFDKDVKDHFTTYLTYLEYLNSPTYDKEMTDVFDANHNLNQPSRAEIERFLAKIEEAASSTKMNAAQRRAFREQIFLQVGSIAMQKNGSYTPDDFPVLKHAIETKLNAEDAKSIAEFFIQQGPGSVVTRRQEEVKKRMGEQNGFCDECIGEAVRHVHNLLRKQNSSA